ncbi:unnamed protein product [Gadus morhua 'NCC']
MVEYTRKSLSMGTGFWSFRHGPGSCDGEAASTDRLLFHREAGGGRLRQGAAAPAGRAPGLGAAGRHGCSLRPVASCCSQRPGSLSVLRDARSRTDAGDRS